MFTELQLVLKSLGEGMESSKCKDDEVFPLSRHFTGLWTVKYLKGWVHKHKHILTHAYYEKNAQK